MTCLHLERRYSEEESGRSRAPWGRSCLKPASDMCESSSFTRYPTRSGSQAEVPQARVAAVSREFDMGPRRGAKSHSGHRTHVRWLFSSSPPQPFDEDDQRVGAARWLAHHSSKSSSILGIREGAASPLLPAPRRVSEHSLLVLQARRPLRDTADLHFDAVRCLLDFAPDFAATLLTNDRTNSFTK